MGQQQLLLIVLGVIIVGIAIVVGINLFTAQSEESAKDALVADCTNIGALAQQYFKKPVAMGGGGNSFAGFVIPTSLQSNANGAYTAGTGTAASITITGTPPAAQKFNFTSVTTTVTPTGIISKVN